MLGAGNRAPHAFRHVLVTAGVGDTEQHHFTLHQIGKVILDGDEDSAALGAAASRRENA